MNLRDMLNVLEPYVLKWIFRSFESWDDLRVDPTARSTGLKVPTFGTFRDGLLVYQFDDAIAANQKEVFFQVQMPHGWREGSAVYPHVHWMPLVAGSAGQVVKWGLEYSVATIGGAFGASTTIYTTTIVGGPVTTQYSHCLSPFASIDMTGNKLSTVFVCRLFRASADAADTLAQTAALLYVDWHYQIDGLGSRTELVK